MGAASMPLGNRDAAPQGRYALPRRVVSAHSTVQDAWVIHNGSVYDVTMFLDSHPGGSLVIQPHLGTDVTQLMSADATHSHSDFAYKMLAAHRIGALADHHDQTTTTVAAAANNAAAAAAAPVVGPDTTSLIHTPAKMPHVDWTSPLLPQIGEMGSRYDSWVHSFPTTDHTVQMFQSPVLEFLTKCPWYVPLLFWLPIIAIVMSYYLATLIPTGQFSAPRFSTFALLGVVAWLFFEYVLHRYLFHMVTTSYWMNILHFLIHGHHHITPMDTNRVVFPPAPALLLGAPVWAAALRILGFDAGYAFLLGFVVGYLHYDMTHYLIHQTAPKSPWLRWHKHRHIKHHYHNPNSNFGISHPLFDVVFRTLLDGSNATSPPL